MTKGTTKDILMGEATAISKDGTRIGYRVTGDGPGLVLVHGAMQTSQNFEKLAFALSCSHRVVRYDRRGRGWSPDGGSDGTPDRYLCETEDLIAVIAATAARHVFGLSFGALIAAGAALAAPSIEKVILYEPPLMIRDVDPGDWADAFLRSLAQQRFGTAMAYIVKGAGDRNLLTFMPRSVLSLLFGLAVRSGAKTPDGEPLKDRLFTVRADIAVQRQASKKLPPLSRLTTDTLLLGGGRSNTKLSRVLDELERELPHAQRSLIPGTGHLAADNDGKPEEVARLIASFLRVD